MISNPIQSALRLCLRRQKAKLNWEFFGLAGPGDPRLPGTYSKLVQSPLLIDLWMEDCQILIIFYICIGSTFFIIGLYTATQNTWDDVLFMHALENAIIVCI